MVKASDFDRKMLQLATQLSHEHDMKALLLTVLEALLKTMSGGDKGGMLVDTMTLIRCIIRLNLRLLADPAANKWSHPFLSCLFLMGVNRTPLIDSLVGHFATGACARSQ
jgi:hypothetical protein